MQRVSLLALLPLVLAACFNPAMQIDHRTAIEQELTRVAIVRALGKLAIPDDVLSGTWKIEVLGPDPRDVGWFRGVLRRRLVALGASISTDARAPLPVVEVDTAFAGSDIDNFFVGVPVPGSGKALSLYQSIAQVGRARIGLTFWSADGELLAQEPSVDASAHYRDVFVLTLIGPFAFSDVEDVEGYNRFFETGADAWHGIDRTGEWSVPGATEEDDDR
jgi:hypothetical protein